MKLFLTEVCEDFDKKCAGCNWEVTRFYTLGKTLVEAKKIFKSNAEDGYGLGLCSDCMCDVLVESRHQIISPK